MQGNTSDIARLWQSRMACQGPASAQVCTTRLGAGVPDRWSATRTATCKAAENDCLERRNSIRPCVPSHAATCKAARNDCLAWRTDQTAHLIARSLRASSPAQSDAGANTASPAAPCSKRCSSTAPLSRSCLNRTLPDVWPHPSVASTH
jgi:hypothetical protein